MLFLVIYVVMGWIVLVVVKLLFENFGLVGFIWLVVGGLFYMVGIIFYVFDNYFWYGYGIWYLFVIVGSVMYFIVILFYVF